MGLTHQIANSEEEALHLFFEGETNRAIAEHQLNKSSTRSHCIFTIHLDIRYCATAIPEPELTIY